MPDGDKTLAPELSFDKWIEKFNAVKGWKRISVPKPEALSRRDGDEKFRSSTEDHFERRIEGIGSKDEIEKQLALDRKALSDKELELAGEKDEGKQQTIRDEIARLTEAIEEGAGDLKTLEGLQNRLDTLQKVEGAVPQELKDLRKRLEQLQDEVAKNAVKINPDDPAAKRFRTFHDMVSGNVENARQEVMTFTTTEKGKEVTRNYAIINSKEYKVLFGRLEAAILLFQLGKIDEATAEVQKAQDELVQFRNARTGAERIAPPVTLSSRIDQELNIAETMIQSLRKAGFNLAADATQTRVDNLTLLIRGDLNAGVPDIEGKHLGACERLSEQATMDVETTIEIRQMLADAARDARAMRTNGWRSRPHRVEEKIAGFIPGAKMSDALTAAEKIRDYAAQKLEESLREDMKAEKIDPVKQAQKLKDLQQRYDALFKHDSEGAVKMIKDSKTGLMKGDKKNSDIPRATLEEIELRVKAAEQLMNSDSIDALKMADTYLNNVGVFLKNIEEHPHVYATFKDDLKEVRKRLTALDKDYALYEVGARMDLKAELEKLEKDYMTKPQAEVQQKILALDKKITDYKDMVSGLRGQKKSLIKLADEIDKTIKGIGERLKKDFEISSEPNPEAKKFTGYYGPLTGELAEARTVIDRRTKDSLAEAQTLLTDLKIKADRSLNLINAFKKDPKTLNDTNFQAAKDFLIESGKAQKDHNADLAAEPTFKKAVEEMEKQEKTLAGLLKKLKADTSDLEALKSELDGIEKAVKKDKSFLKGIEDIKPLATRMAKLLLEATNAGQIVDASLGDAARMVAKSVTDFRTQVSEFYDKVIYPAAATDTGNQIDAGVFDGAKIKTFLNSIVAAIPEKALTELETASRTVGDTTLDKSVRKNARKTALAHVRSLTAVLDGFKPVSHFRTHTFGDTAANAAFTGARQALPRLEIRLLTAIAD